MEDQLKNDFEKIITTSNFSSKDINIKKNYLNEFIKKGFPNRKLENWKFSDISQIIKKNIGELDFFNDYSFKNKIDSSIFVSGLEHNKIVFINGRIEKIEFNYEDENKIEILDKIELKNKPNFENSLLDLNNALTYKYYKIVVKDNYSLKKPLIIYHTTNENLHLKNINLRLDFLLKKNSSLKLVDISKDLSEKNFINVLYNFELKKREEAATDQENLKSEIGWGHQIRSYVLHPYRLVKDNRTNYESTNPDKVLDGQIDDFLENFLYTKND